MQYYINPQNGDRLSRLGFGCMRLPADDNLAITLVRSAIDQGINYLDTAYIYPGNEVLLGKILKDGYREKVKIATKLPFYMCKSRADMDRLFIHELKRLQTDHIDYYLMHMLNAKSDWDRMVSIGAIDWINEKKSSGQIVNIGFSFHGTYSSFAEIIDAYHWDFCMIQYNYLDTNHQAGQNGLHYAYAKGVPVFIMEPLRGGKLATNLPPDAFSAFEQANPSNSPAQFALRWLFDQREVAVVLSGMTNEAALKENLEAAKCAPLTPKEQKAIEEAHRAILKCMQIPCTACGYCMPCPQGVDIPMCFSFYNDTAGTRAFQARINYIMRAAKHEASLCTQCGKCEKHCPQHIAIRQCLNDVRYHMERFPYKLLRLIVTKFLKR